ncbi:N-acetyltransferase family protein [Thalassotalea ganghwensis]
MFSRSDDEITIVLATESDAKDIAEIYNHYIEHTVVTFEETPIDAREIVNRINKVNASGLIWVVAKNKQGETLGYAYATKWRERFSYRYSVEVTVYLNRQFQGRGIGSLLYQTLFNELKVKGIHVAIAGITLPNEASVKLHEKFGMIKVAHFNEVGLKFDQWQDVGYWQVTL